MLLRQIDSATGLKVEPVFHSRMQWRCTRKTLGCLCFHFLWFVLSSSYRVRMAARRLGPDRLCSTNGNGTSSGMGAKIFNLHPHDFIT